MKKKRTYQELEKEIEIFKRKNNILSQENKELKTENEELSVFKQANSESDYYGNELNNEKYLLNVLMENIPSRIYFKNKNGEFVRVNKRLAKKHGFNTVNEVLGKTDFDFFIKKNAQKSFDDEQEIIKTGKPLIDYEEKDIWTNGEIGWASSTKVPMYNKQNKVIGIFGITKDITDRKHAEQALKESNATKNKFFSIIAHDLRSPFNTMLGFSKLLINNFENYDVQEQKKFLNIINNDMQNTYKLLENLLMWSQSQQGAIDFNPEKENLYLLTEEVIALLKPVANNKLIKLTNQIVKDIVIKADKNMLLTILRNLISNAIKFTPKGGVIEIGVAKRHGVSQHEIYVKDNGIGISKEKINYLFDISKNTSTKGTEKEEGTGLGLILCKEFVEKHGGKIWVESEESKGSKFVVTLPI